jgi:hypothetical protein
MTEMAEHIEAQAPAEGQLPTWRRVVLALGRLEPSADASGLVYGLIVASVVITAQAHYDASYPAVISVTAATVTVYWLTHAYCHLLAHSIRRGRPGTWDHVTTTLREESAVLWGGLAELAAVTVGLMLGLGINGADWLAIGVTILLLFAWGLVAGVRNGARTRLVLANALLGAMLGALVAVLKLLLK